MTVKIGKITVHFEKNHGKIKAFCSFTYNLHSTVNVKQEK